MKQEIMEKLINDKELSTTEIVYIGKNLNNITGWKDIPYNHSVGSTLEACGLLEKDVEELNSLLRNVMNGIKAKSISEIVERIEKLTCSDERYMRMMIFQALAYAQEKAAMASNIGDILRKLLGEGDNKQGNKE